MIYLASPYSGTQEEMQSRYLETERATAYWLSQGKIIYSPIVHCHELARKYSLPTDFLFWQHYNRGMLRLASELWIFKLPGWTESNGVTAEVNFAQQLDIEIMTLDPASNVVRKLVS